MRWRVWNILAHISQDYAYYIFKCNRGGYSSTTIVCWLLYCDPLVAGFLLRDRIPCYMGTERGHRSPFHRYFSKYLSTSRASRLLVETPSYPKGKNMPQSQLLTCLGQFTSFIFLLKDTSAFDNLSINSTA